MYRIDRHVYVYMKRLLPLVRQISETRYGQPLEAINENNLPLLCKKLLPTCASEYKLGAANQSTQRVRSIRSEPCLSDDIQARLRESLRIASMADLVRAWH